MMTTKKRRGNLPALAVIAVAGALLTACNPPGARDLRQGEKDIKAGEFRAAIAPLSDATHALSSAPPAAQSKAWNLLGLAYQGAGQFDAASQAYSQALKLNHNNEAVDFNLGCLRMAQSNFSGAVDCFTTCVTLNPQGVDAFLKLGATRYRLALEKTGPDRAGLLEKARRDFESAEKLHPTAEAANAIGMIELQRHNGTTEAARAAADFQRAVERDPHYGPALLDLAITYHQYLNQIPKAVQYYRQYLALQPSPPHAREIEKLAHQLEVESHTTIAPGSSAHPSPPPPRAIVSSTNPTPAFPKTTPAEPPISKATNPVPAPAPKSENQIASVPVEVTLPPPAPPPKPALPTPPPETNSSVNTVIATNDIAAQGTATNVPVTSQKKTLVQKLNPAHWFAGKPKTSGETPGVPDVKRYKYPSRVTPIPGNRKEAERLAALGAQLGRLGRLGDAVHTYQNATVADPTYFNAGLSLGLTAIDAGDYDIALDALCRVLALDDDSANARYAFAWTLQKRGFYVDAAKELENLLAAHPDEARGHLLLGNLYADRLGQPKEARQHYAKVLELDPGNSQVPAIRAWILKTP
jgi:tetratricopeptide (TPR) repeat protein